MPQTITLSLTPEQASDPRQYEPAVIRRSGVGADRIASIRLKRKSVDARGKNIRIDMEFDVYIDDERPADRIVPAWKDVTLATPVIIVGSGPAGLFAALRLMELGYKPLLLERGKDVSARKRDIADLNKNLPVNPESNYCFGEGGAGTYSDGKLYTRSKKRGNYRRALEILHYHGASESVLYDAHPHIGTDQLPRVVAAIRETIRRNGGEIHFNCRVTDLLIKDDAIRGVSDQSGNRIEGAAVILATGHSARDIYYLLHDKHILLEAKPFAMGVRVEHPQALIDSIQYKTDRRSPYLPAASYTLVGQEGGRGVYSFCMCPGGFIVPASTAPQESVVNGMSPSGRNSVFANSGIVTEIKASDYAFLHETYGVLAGLRFQQLFEQSAYANGGGNQIVPAQRLTDFVSGRFSKTLPHTSYRPGVVSSIAAAWMPEFIYKSLAAGFKSFDRKMKGFLTEEAMILGVESRTSSPVRIPRSPETRMHPQTDGLFPCGEGAGYAGGIISAAVDGENSAEAVARYLNR